MLDPELILTPELRERYRRLQERTECLTEQMRWQASQVLHTVDDYHEATRLFSRRLQTAEIKLVVDAGTFDIAVLVCGPWITKRLLWRLKDYLQNRAPIGVHILVARIP